MNGSGLTEEQRASLRAIPGHPGYYINIEGEVWSEHTKRWRKRNKTSTVILSGSNRSHMSVYALVLDAFPEFAIDIGESMLKKGVDQETLADFLGVGSQTVYTWITNGSVTARYSAPSTFTPTCCRPCKSPPVTLACSPTMLWANVSDGIRLLKLDEKWNSPDAYPTGPLVDGPALVAKLQALTPGQTLAVVDAIERFWGDCENSTVQSVGLTKENSNVQA